MTDDELRDRVCGSKRSYDSRGGAERARERMIEQGADQHPVGLAPYRCPLCRCYHLGHAPSMATLEDLARIIRRLPKGACS